MAIAALAAAIACVLGAAAAAAATVTLRIEGSAQTLFEGPVTTLPHAVDGGDGSGPHPCSGGLGSTSGPTATTALDDGVRAAGIPWRGNWNPDFYDFFVDSIGPDSSTPPEGYWAVLVNGISVGGGCTTKVKDGDEVLWVYGAAFKPLVLRLSGPSAAEVGQPFAVTVTAGGKPMAGAAVGGRLTDSSGTATLMSAEPARLLLKAERSDAIRSNGLAVCVGVEVGCEPSPPAQVPHLSIEKIEPGSLFALGAAPRILRGAASAVAGVDLALTTHDEGRCRSWNPDQAGLTRTPCERPRRFAAKVEGGSWKARIGRLEPGRYTLAAGSSAGTRSAASVRFRVLKRPGRAGSLLRRGLSYLASSQHRNGGFGVSAGAPPSLGMTGWATMALGAVRASGAALGAGYLRGALRGTDPIADQVRSAFAVALAGSDPFFSRALCVRLARRRGPGGSFGANVNATALAVLALKDSHCAARAMIRAARWIDRQRNGDGGFGFRKGIVSDVDTTGLATWALASVSQTRQAASTGVPFLRKAQNYDGGFGASTGALSNSQSTGLALAGLRALGIAPGSIRTEDRIDPIDYLTTLQRGPGAIYYSRRDRPTPVWTTSHALLGLGSQPPDR